MITNAFRWLVGNLSTLVLAFALAVVVWVSSVVSDNPNIECETPNAVDLEIIGQDPALELLGELPDRVEIQLFAPLSVCEELQATGIGTAKIDLSGVTSGQHTVPIEPPLIDMEPVRIVDYTPREVNLQLEQIVSETFVINLQVTGEVGLGFQAAPAVLDAYQVTVSGPRTQVDQVVQVQASLDLSGARESVQRTVSLQALNEAGQPVPEVSVAPSRVLVTQPIVQLGRYRELAVQVKTTGQWASGYRLTSISVSPPTVTVFSEEPDRVNELPGFVETEAIDLEGANDDITENVRLSLPEGVSLVGRETVFVQVSIAAIEDNLIVALPIEVIGLSPELQVEISPEAVDVILFGPLPVLENLTSANVRVVVDLTGLTVGVWQVEPLVDILPARVEEQGINPSVVEVNISPLPTPTPSPTPGGPGTPTPSPIP
jgi:YbbR domain-containing protein